ncbi:ribbon-helix-helix domain-containing protein [Actinoallomurus rhizosphaericola]|uniref:ribbon-helix-helix domain-containing protein n=1 Tax=Actinoallomurus rhizosphaericola TaxID=2952536 RepID=UPI0020934917|nr:ribbon-helix-helix domain-containing protein [Actinoallomurus rhizosphaericola]MCO5996032.1 ribbon-helix-helix domain-containing protein [Actinoallomurus rhizosphaericola]
MTRGMMSSMKVGVSIPDEDVAFIDEYAARTGAKSRSAVLHQAIGLLRSTALEDAYAAAWQEPDYSSEAELWDATSSDGMADATR